VAELFEDAISDVTPSEPPEDLSATRLPTVPDAVGIVLDDFAPSPGAGADDHAGPGGPAIASGGVIGFAELPIPPVASDALFAGGHFTDLGIAVTTGVATPVAGTVGTDAVATESVGESTPHAEDHHGDHDPSSGGDHALAHVAAAVSAVAPLDDLGLHGHGLL
jgi:hypothetical protein